MMPLVEDGSDASTPTASGKMLQRRVDPTPLDVSIMGTNDSSIVSKRSVEKLYLPEPHFFRYFVKKPKRRSPLINRGYWLRMRSIEYELSCFLKSPSPKKKVVVNLGCGYDPLPFATLAKQQDLTANVSFVDVDYPSLIKNKVAMIQAAEAIKNLLGKADVNLSEGTIFRSEQYIALGCDLTQPTILEEQLRSFFDLSNTTICFLAEVSVTYMKGRDADRLIRWAAKLPNARFVQLEQCLPWGPEHPFAATMLRHFSRLGTRLRSLKRFPTLQAQEARFKNHGWAEVRARHLWDLWCDNDFLSRDQRMSLDQVEAFDEWEEFALYGQHYFTLVATTTPSRAAFSDSIKPPTPSRTKHGQTTKTGGFEIQLALQDISPRSFGAVIEPGTAILCHHAGQGSQRRLATTDIYTSRVGCDSIKTLIPSVGDRLGHTITRLKPSRRHLLVGGRTSPDKSLLDCWLFDGSHWQRDQGLPFGLYRHCATNVRFGHEPSSATNRVDDGSYILIYGGKMSTATISDQWLLWSSSHMNSEEQAQAYSWTKLVTQGDTAKPLFGANMIQLSDPISQGVARGLLIGGMTADGVVNDEIYEWTIDLTDFTITNKLTSSSNKARICRFGAQVVQRTSEPDRFYVIGGVVESGSSLSDYEPVIEVIHTNSPLEYYKSDEEPLAVKKISCKDGVESLFNSGALLVGHSAICIEDEILVVGGGATCFSFGTFHNRAMWSISSNYRTNSDHDGRRRVWRRIVEIAETTAQCKPSASAIASSQQEERHLDHMDQVEVQSVDIDFAQIISESRPRLLRGINLGECLGLWTSDYLGAKVGREREVTAHYSEVDVMNFQDKNFSYKRMPFGQFLDEIEAGGRHYLRALSSISIDKPANFWEDYPSLSDDFQLPECLATYIGKPPTTDKKPEIGSEIDGPNRFHSAVLRLSGPTAMWLHYDVMSNVLCQIRGRKRMLLFPPTDAVKLGIGPGQSSSRLNVFADGNFMGCRVLEALLEPGDVLFIPAFWLHAAQPLDTLSLAINVFFRDVSMGYAPGKDAYGNRDLHAYEDGRRQLAKINAKLHREPTSARRFYLTRLAHELQTMADEAS